MGLAEILNNISENNGIIRQNYPVDIDKARKNFEALANKMLEKKNKVFQIENVRDNVDSLLKWTHQIGDDLDFNKGILLKGHTGRGKTFLFRVWREYLKIDLPQFIQNGILTPIMPRIVTVTKIAGEFQDQDTGGYKIINKYAKYNCIVLDDIGKEQPESISWGNRLNVVEQIINIREENGLLTFGTTNLNHTSELYDDRVVSRMNEMFNVIGINHDVDFRRKK